jgi:RNA ligase (TIGR02306 family)
MIPTKVGEIQTTEKKISSATSIQITNTTEEIMSQEFAVKVVAIKNVLVHPNADRLELAEIAGWQCVIQKGAYKAGDLAVYIPIDSILPDAVERTLFGPDSKIKLHKSRVKTIKIRGAISQGMLAPCGDLGVPATEGYDCTKDLAITKFEPQDTPTHLGGGPNVGKKVVKKNPHFKEYGGLDNFKHYPELFKAGEPCVIQEKVHGTNFRFGWVPAAADTPLKRIKKMFGLLPRYEFVFGSNKVQLQNRTSSKNKWKVKLLSWIPIKAIRTVAYQGYYEQSGVGNVYEEAVREYGLKELTNKPHLMNKIFYGEIYGSSIQKNYNYGCPEGVRKLVCFDVLKVFEPGTEPDASGGTETGFLHALDAEGLVRSIGLDWVPSLYEGPYVSNEHAKSLTVGNSVMVPSQKVMEGVVVKPIIETKCHIGRKALKLISDEYYLRDDNTDFH